MNGEGLRDPSRKIDLSFGERAVGNGNLTLIIDREGRWCDIPCASDAQTLLDLIENYFKPRVASEITRLKQLQTLAHDPDSDFIEKLGVGLFYYEPPESGMMEEEAWKGALAQALIDAGYTLNPIPSHLRRSLLTEKEGYLDEWINPLSYWGVSSLMTTSLVLCPAFSWYEPGLSSGECIAVGYKAAIGIDGTAILQLLQPDEIQTWEGNPNLSRVYTETIRKHIAAMLG